MIFHSSTRHDIEKYYYGTFVKFKETGDRVWKIVGVTAAHVRCQDSTGFDVYIDLSEKYHVEYIIPGRRVFQSGDEAFMLYRKPARQYFRGMHPENTGFACLDGNGNWKEVGLDFSYIENYVNKPNYHTLEEVSQLKKKSYALNNQIAVGKNGAVVFGFNKIGVIIPSAHTGLFTPVYKTELAAMFQSLQLKWEPTTGAL